MKRAILTMAILASLSGTALVVVNELTAHRIAANLQRFSERQQREIWPGTNISFIERDAHTWTVQTDEQVLGTMHRVVTSEGYNGNITLWVGVRSNFEIQGVRVIQHRETPGLGDKIERAVSDWIESFNGRSLNQHNTATWDVQSHGGTFDQFTGATITPRAVVHAARDVLAQFNGDLAATDGESVV